MIISSWSKCRGSYVLGVHIAGHVELLCRVLLSQLCTSQLFYWLFIPSFITWRHSWATVHKFTGPGALIEHIHVPAYCTTPLKQSTQVCWQPLPPLLGLLRAWAKSTWPAVRRYGQKACNKMHYLWCSWAMPNDLKPTEASFFANSNWLTSCSDDRYANPSSGRSRI